jgi:crotonobetainyl-CoA:carnitine CoA-transferase CaiB-like acyl-CoA transferase
MAEGPAFTVTGVGPTAEHARWLHRVLGAEDGGPVVALDDAPSPLADWAASGAMALTGRADGPPLPAPGNPAGAVRAALAVLGALTVARGELPGVGLLGERAAIAGLTRRGPWSCGSTFRMVSTVDGWVGLSLARDSDRAALPALTQSSTVDDWPALTRWLRTQPSAEVAQRAQLLGLAANVVPSPPGPAVRITPGGLRRPTGSPLVVDLTALWAGPLCAHLLGLTGAQVVKVESPHRPDGARSGPADFFDLLHAGHASVALDFTDERDRARLRRLIEQADVVLESSRPRALRQLGIDAEATVAAGTIWTSITAYGRVGSAGELVGFGDDVAAAAGLFVTDGADRLPCGDAIADPVTGVHAAVATAAALRRDRACLIDISMRDITAATLRPVPATDQTVAAAAPVARPVTAHAAPMGHDNSSFVD